MLATLLGACFLTGLHAWATPPLRVAKVFDGRAMTCDQERLGERGFRLRDVAVRFASPPRLSGRVEAWDCTPAGFVAAALRSPLRRTVFGVATETVFPDIRLVLTDDTTSFAIEIVLQDGAFDLDLPPGVGVVDLFIKGQARTTAAGATTPIEDHFSSGAFRIWLRSLGLHRPPGG